MPRARRRCARPDCDQLAPCPDHRPEPWQGSTRRATLPAGWSSRIVPAILERDPTCQLAYPGSWPVAGRVASCTVTSREVDHVGSPDDHTPGNLRGVCPECHQRRTLEQRAAGHVAASE